SMRRTNKTLRTISFILLQAFLAQQVSWADITPTRQNLFQKPQVGLKIPDSVATIEDVYLADSVKRTENPLTLTAERLPLIYLLQDAHTNESGQYNLSKALDLILQKEKDLKYVFTEAGVGDNSLAYLKPFRPDNERKQIARTYIKKGILHGAEYLSLTSDRPFTLWGVENPDLYLKSIQDYRQVAKERERFDLYLKKIDRTIETLKNRLANPSLQTFSKERKEYRLNRLPLTSYFNALSREAEIHNIPLSGYPHLNTLKALKDKESNIDFKKANTEHQEALKSLPQEVQTDLKDLADTKKTDKVLSDNQKNERAYFALLEEKLGARSSELGASNYPELSKYFDYLELSKDLEAKEVLSQMKALEDRIIENLARTQDEKTLMRSESVLRHLEKLFHFTLTPEEFKDYKDLTGDSFNIEYLTGFLNKKIMDLGTYYEQALFLEKGYQEVIRHAENFYALTIERDNFFVESMLKKMDEDSGVQHTGDSVQRTAYSGQKSAVLITGGFHTANLKQLLKSKGISFVSITPQILQETNMAKYESLLIGS
ncbi:MAG: hypothetical protein AABZ62_03940, partial [Planctomycetota bacterium]